MKGIITFIFILSGFLARADDTQLLQDMVNNARGSFVFPAGVTYHISGSINMPSATFDFNGCVIVITSDNIALLVNHSGTQINNVEITGLWDLKNSTLPGVGSSGIAVTGANCKLRNNYLHHLSAYGILGNGDNVDIQYNRIISTGYIAVFWYTSEVSVKGGCIAHNYINRSSIAPNTIREKAICIKGNQQNHSSRWTISENKIYMPLHPNDWSAEGIELFENCDSSIVTRNVIDGGSIGISFVQSVYVRGSENTLRNQKLEALELANCTYSVLNNNIITDAALGILFDGGILCSNNQALGNSISTFVAGVEINVKCPDNTISGGTISCKRAVSIIGSSGTIIRNVQVTGPGTGQAFMLDGSNIRGVPPSNTTILGCKISGYTYACYLYANKAGRTDSINARGNTYIHTQYKWKTDLSKGATIGANILTD
jgi:hypothetical protein